MDIGLWQADAAWGCIDLLSDVHLSADAPQTFEAWQRHLLSTPADAILILGDLFEVWVGDDARLAGFESECLRVLRLASARRSVAFMAGNRDFLVGPDMLRDSGMLGLSDPTVACAFGERLLLSHGDALCVSDGAYQAFRREVRNPKWQSAFLSLPLSARQARARAMREASTEHQAGMSPDDWADVDHALAAEWLATASCQVLVHGHTHRPATHPLPNGRTRRVLGDWQFDAQPVRARMLRWTASGLDELDLATP